MGDRIARLWLMAFCSCISLVVGTKFHVTINLYFYQWSFRFDKWILSHLQVPLSLKPVTEHLSTPSIEADDIGPFDDDLRKNHTLTEEEYLPHLPSDSR